MWPGHPDARPGARARRPGVSPRSTRARRHAYEDASGHEGALQRLRIRPFSPIARRLGYARQDLEPRMGTEQAPEYRRGLFSVGHDRGIRVGPPSAEANCHGGSPHQVLGPAVSPGQVHDRPFAHVRERRGPASTGFRAIPTQQEEPSAQQPVKRRCEQPSDDWIQEPQDRAQQRPAQSWPSDAVQHPRSDIGAARIGPWAVTPGNPSACGCGWGGEACAGPWPRSAESARGSR